MNSIEEETFGFFGGYYRSTTWMVSEWTSASREGKGSNVI